MVHQCIEPQDADSHVIKGDLEPSLQMDVPEGQPDNDDRHVQSNHQLPHEAHMCTWKMGNEPEVLNCQHASR